MPHAILKPSIDAVFKRLMSDTVLLVSFLQAALDLPPEDYHDVKLVDPHLMGERPDDKMGILDVKLTTAQGKIIDIEIQLAPTPEMRGRIIFYLAKMVTEQIGRGEDYRQIQRVISILITGYEEIRDSSRYHNRYWLYDPETGSRFSDLLEIDTLELPKLPASGDETKLCHWLQFIKATKEEEFDMLATQDPDIGRAVVKLKELSQDERLRELAISREKMEWDNAARLRGARQEGDKNARLAVAHKLMQGGLSIEDVMKYTDLSRDEILALQTH
jgi:predicted transposase/invertase (TIGR01784 family)